MKSIDFKQCAADPCIFVREEGADLFIVAVYVDDLTIITKTSATMKIIKESLAKRFKMKDLGKLSYCLEINIEYDELTKSLWLHQRQYIQSLLVGFSDADWAGDMDDRHSTTGNLFLVSGGAVSWLSRKQPVVALSKTEAEYVSLSTTTQEAVWLRRLLSEIKAIPATPTVIKEDNQGTIAVAKNPISHARTKHIDIKFHYVREALQDELVEIFYCPTELMAVDILTKPLTRNCFETLRLLMGLKDLPSQK